jgi:hypothetical protein
MRGVARLAPQQAVSSTAAFLSQALAACAAAGATAAARQVALEAAVQLLEAVLPALTGGEAAAAAAAAAASGGPAAGGGAAAAAAAAAAAPPAVADPAVAEALRGMLQRLLALRLRDPILVMLVGRADLIGELHIATKGPGRGASPSTEAWGASL